MAAGPLGDGQVSPDGPLGRAPALATLRGNGLYEASGNARVDVLAPERSSPETVTARFRISSEGPGRVSPGMTDSPHNNFYDDGPGTFLAISLVDLPGR